LVEEIPLEKLDFDTKFNNLIHWLKTTSDGCYFDKLEIFNIALDYRGIRNKSPIKEKERVIEIPESHFITYEIAKDSEYCKSIVDNKLEFWSDHSYIAIYILESLKDPNSHWKYYFATVP